MKKDNFQKYIENIAKTGFGLEFWTSQVLKDNGWSVINNKYYLDDQQSTVREIDIVAYKVRKVQHFMVYTALIVSCKKSENNIWALLSKDVDKKDPNIDWLPLHLWTNDKALEFMVCQSEFKSNFFAKIFNIKKSIPIGFPRHHVFAFQEMNKESAKPQNDRPIFDSVTSLMKAQAYELDALSQRKKVPVIYQFNLLSVFDTELIRIHFSKGGTEAYKENTLDYVANYIINKKETFARVHFVQKGSLASLLDEYSNLHDANCEVFDSTCNRFYEDAVKDSNKNKIFFDDFLKELLWAVRWRLHHKFGGSSNLEGTWLWWKDDRNVLSIQLEAHKEEIDFLNEDQQLTKKTRDLLKKYYRYQGRFEFAVDEIPF